MQNQMSKPFPWLLLVSRSALFLSVQAIIALGFFLTGAPNAWDLSARWWPLAISAANLITLAALIPLLHGEGKNYWALFHFERGTVKRDILIFLGITILAVPIAMLPNIFLGLALFGDSMTSLNLLVGPLPFWAVYAAMVLFPITQGLVEIAVYFGVAMPRLEAQGLKPWLAVSIPALFLGLQHVFIPLLLDPRFMLWRGLMYLPFAFLLGIVLHWRPRLLPYLAILHVLLDIGAVALFLSSAY